MSYVLDFIEGGVPAPENINHASLPGATNAPINCTITLNQKENGNTVANNGTFIASTDGKQIFCHLQITKGTEHQSINRAILKLRATGTTSTSPFKVQLAEANGNNPGATVNYANYKADIETPTIGYYLVDIGKLIPDCDERDLYLLISSDTTGAVMKVQGASTAMLELEYMSDNDHIPNVSKIEKKVGTKGAYSINTRNGKLFYKQDLYQAPGRRMPFTLSLTYNTADCNNSSPNGIPTGIKGWTFNYAQSFVADDYGYKFLDSAHTYRRFINADNSTTIWFDKDGRSGITAKAVSGKMQLSDGKTATLKFDTSGRLTELLSQKGASALTTNIYYSTNGKISYIVDGMGDRYDFTYTTTKITISKNQGSGLVELELNGELLKKVTYLLSGETVTFGYDNDKLIWVSDLGSLVKTEFSYFSNTKMIQNARNYSIGTDGNINASIDGDFFTYKTLMTKVAHSRYSSTDETAYSTTVYRFAQDGETIFTGEERSDQSFPGMVFRNKSDYERYTLSLPDQVAGEFAFTETNYPNGEMQNPTRTSETLAFKVFPTDYPRFVFAAQMEIKYSNLMDSPSATEKVYVDLKKDTTTLCTLEFNPHLEEQQAQCSFVDLASGTHNLKAVFRANGKVNIENFACALFDTQHGLQGEFTNVATGQSSAIERKSNGTSTTWHHLSRCNIHYGSTTLYNVKYTVNDYTLTTISRLQNGNNFNLWYNDGANMVAGVSGAAIEFLYGNNQHTGTHSISAVKCCQLNQVMGKNVFRYLEPSTSYFLKAITNTVSTYLPEGETTYKNVLCSEEIDSSFRKIQTVDEKGRTTRYTYNTYGDVLTEKITAPNSTIMNELITNTYDSKGNLLTEKEYRYLEDYIHSYAYTDNLLSSETLPNGFVQNYTYSNDKEKLTRIHTNDPSGVANDMAYVNNLVTQMTHNNSNVTLEYNDRHNLQKVKIGTNVVMNKAYTYNSDGSLITITTYGNGYKHKKQYDKFERLIKESDVTNGETLLCSYIYSDTEVANSITNPQDASLKISSSSKLRAKIDHTTNRRTNYTYDSKGQLIQTNRGDLIITADEFDAYGRVTKSTTFANATYVTNQCVYEDIVGEEVVSEKITTGSNVTADVTYTKDGLGRPITEKIMQGTKGISTDYAYIPRQELQSGTNRAGNISPKGVVLPPEFEEEVNVGTSPFIESVKYYTHNNGAVTLSKTEAVEYDENGNITKYGGTTYQYDKMGRLVRENNQALAKTFVMAYNKGGNITSKKEYAYTTGSVGTATSTKNYSYGNTQWADKLTSYNGQGIVYDNMGNPTSYKGATLGWSRGRLLTSFKPSGSAITYNMGYDKDGVRCSKSYTSGSIEYYTTYAYNGTCLLSQKTSTLGGIPTTSTMRFLYGQNGLVGFIIDGITYTYRKNLFGDIIGIFSGNTEMATYVYDAWGNCTITKNTNGLGTLNPFRYRGYYWDSNLGLYYLISRYYDPQTGRFINSDSLDYLDPQTLGGLNLYAYCGNNPVNKSDPSGHSALLIGMLIGFAVGFFVGGGFEIAKQAYNGGDWNWDVSSWNWGQIGLSALGGGVAGAISSISFGSGVVGYLTTFATGGIGSVLGGMISGSVTDLQSGLIAFGIGAVGNVAARGITALINKGVSASAQKALNNPIFDDMTLEDLVGSGLKNNGYAPAYNKFLNYVGNLVLKANGQWARSIMYSFANSGISSLLSGWY